MAFGYLVLFIGGKQYLKEYFQSGGEAGAGTPTVAELYPTPLPAMPPADSQETPGTPADKKSGRVVMEYITRDSVAKNAIQNLDDYEYNYVFQNESDRELSTDLRNKLMSQRPMDWAGLPPSSSQFQAGLRESFANATQKVPEENKPYSESPFKDMEGESMNPPDTLQLEMEERKVLQSYQAPTAKDMLTYSADDAAAQDPQELIHKLYDKKGLIPTVAHEEGTNVYEVIGVRRKDEKIVYEDEEPEAPATTDPVGTAGEATISVPAAAYDMAAAKDPFYTPTTGGSGASRTDRWNYQSWTPGLERMFAPTNPQQNWY